MAGPSSLTLDFTSLLTSTLMNQSSLLADAITASNYFFFRLKEMGLIRETADLGERMKLNIRYGLPAVDSYAGYDELNVDPIDNLTSAFYDWRNAAVPVSISGDDKAKNRGEFQIIDLLTEKGEAARDSIQEFWGKAFLQGNGINTPTQITTPYTSPVNGSVFLQPLFDLVRFDPTASVSVGNINQATHTWWRNRLVNDASTTFAGFRKNLRNLFNTCSRGAGGKPDIHLTDQATYEFYEEMLTFFHQNPSYARADIPFENLAFRGFPVTWDEFMPDAAGGTTVQSATSGTWAMLNSRFLVIKSDSMQNFRARPAQEPFNQDASISHVMYRGAVGTNNRKKHGVMGSIDTTITS